MTTDKQDAADSVPGEVRSSDPLGPAAEAKRLAELYQRNPEWFGGDEVDELCRLIDAAVAAEHAKRRGLAIELDSLLRAHEAQGDGRVTTRQVREAVEPYLKA